MNLHDFTVIALQGRLADADVSPEEQLDLIDQKAPDPRRMDSSLPL